jgi:anti-sigma B factor antagonist
MKISISDFGTAAKRVTLTGKLDIAGAQKIELPLATLAGTRGNLVIDMAGVDFIASIGIRQLVMAAKAITRGAGRLVLLGPTAAVTEALEMSGLLDLLPIVRSEEEAQTALAR